MLRKIMGMRNLVVQWRSWDRVLKKKQFSIDMTYKALHCAGEKKKWSTLVSRNHASFSEKFII